MVAHVEHGLSPVETVEEPVALIVGAEPQQDLAELLHAQCGLARLLQPELRAALLGGVHLPQPLDVRVVCHRELGIGGRRVGRPFTIKPGLSGAARARPARERQSRDQQQSRPVDPPLARRHHSSL